MSFLGLIAITVLITACAPKVSLTPPPAPVATAVATPKLAAPAPITPTPSPEVKAPVAKPKAYVYVTNPEGTSYYRAAVAQAALITKYTGLNILVQPAGGIRVTPGIVGKGEAQISITTSLSGPAAYTGIREFTGEKHPYIRALMVGHPTMYSVVVKADSGMKKVPDLKGKKINIKQLGPIGQELTVVAMLKAYGMDPEKDVTQVTATDSAEAMRMVKDGRLDGYSTSITEPSVAELDRAVGAYVIPLDTDKVEAVKIAVPGLTSYKVKDMPGVKSEIIAMGSPAILWAHQNLSDDIAYTIVKTLFENQKELEPVHSDFKHWTLETTAEKGADIGLPFHNGAIKYLKEKGLWTARMEGVQQELLKIYAK
jgi:hypothetical protein